MSETEIKLQTAKFSLADSITKFATAVVLATMAWIGFIHLVMGLVEQMTENILEQLKLAQEQLKFSTEHVKYVTSLCNYQQPRSLRLERYSLCLVIS